MMPLQIDNKLDATLPDVNRGLRDFVWEIGRAISADSSNGIIPRSAETVAVVLRKLLEVCEALEDRPGCADCYYHLGNLAYLRRDNDAAAEAYAAAEAAFGELGDRAGLARVIHQQGLLAQRRGDYPFARQRYTRSAEISTELKDRTGLARAYNQLGNVAYLCGDDDEASEQYARALENAEATRDLPAATNAAYWLGLVCQRRGEQDRSLKWLRKALGIAETLSDHQTVARCSFQFGMLAEIAGEGSGALAHYEKAVRRWKACGDSAGAARAFERISEIYFAAGSPDVGLPFALRAYAMRRESETAGDHDSVAAFRRFRDALGEAAFSVIVGNTLTAAQAQGIFEALARPLPVAAVGARG